MLKSAVVAPRSANTAADAAVTNPFAFTVNFVKEPTFELTVDSVPVPVTLPVPSNDPDV